MLSNTVQRPVFSYCRIQTYSFIFKKKKYLQCTLYVDTFIHDGAIVCPCVDILKHEQFIHLSLYWIFFLPRQGGRCWGGGGGRSLTLENSWMVFHTIYHAEWFSKNYVDIKNQNHSVLNSGVATVWKVWISTLIQSDSSHRSPSFFLIARVSTRNSKILKGVWHEIFDFRFFSWISFPLGLSILMGPLWIVRKFAEIFPTLCLSPVSLTPVIKPCPKFSSIPWHRRLIYRRCQQHRRWNKIRLPTPQSEH
jgi:hypothetical protein